MGLTTTARSQPFALLQAPLPRTTWGGDPGQQQGGLPPPLSPNKNVYCCQMKKFRRKEKEEIPQNAQLSFARMTPTTRTHWKQEILSEAQYLASQQQVRGDAVIFLDILSFCSHPVLPVQLTMPPWRQGALGNLPRSAWPLLHPSSDPAGTGEEASPSQGTNLYPWAAGTLTPFFQRVKVPTCPYISNQLSVSGFKCKGHLN